MSYVSRNSLGYLGQKADGSTQIDNTARDWTTATTVGSGLVTGIASLIGAATGQPATPAVPAAPIAPLAPAPATADWYWPTIIGVGVAVFGGIAYMSWNVKKPVKANRRRRARRSVRRNSGVKVGDRVRFSDRFLDWYPSRQEAKSHRGVVEEFVDPETVFVRWDAGGPSYSKSMVNTANLTVTDA